MDLSFRSAKKELIDQQDIPFGDIRQNMIELEIINSRLGGHQITIEGFKKLVSLPADQKKFLVCEIGCGGGDNLKAIERFNNKKQLDLSFIGIDINPETIRYAARNCSSLKNICFITADYKAAKFIDQPDIIFSSLFCHHFTNQELIEILKWNKANARIGFFINDLQRHWLAYKAIKLLSALFSKSYLLKNDAPVSVLKGFRKKELKELLQKAGINNFTIHWRWAFRWLIIVKNNNHS
jgi:Methylase involved in ubiquinone/menaquinone biosynthesis